MKVKDKLSLCQKDIYFGFNIVCKYFPYDKEEFYRLEKLKALIFEDDNSKTNNVSKNVYFKPTKVNNKK